MAASATQVYEQHVKTLPAGERLELLALIARELAAERNAAPERPKHRLTELRGLGKEIWEGIDAQEYVNKLRDEWHEPRP
jgi:hypothetical protein